MVITETATQPRPSPNAAAAIPNADASDQFVADPLMVAFVTGSPRTSRHAKVTVTS